MCEYRTVSGPGLDGPLYSYNVYVLLEAGSCIPEAGKCSYMHEERMGISKELHKFNLHPLWF